jgi:hypothetical protein
MTDPVARDRPEVLDTTGADLLGTMAFLSMAMRWAVFEENPKVGGSAEMRDIRDRIDRALEAASGTPEPPEPTVVPGVLRNADPSAPLVRWPAPPPAAPGLRDDEDDLDPALAAWFNARADAIRAVASYRASLPEYPGLALVPVADLDRLARYVELPKTRAALAAPGLREALDIHAAVRAGLDTGDGDRIIGARFVGLMLGIDLARRHPDAASRLREAMAVMQDSSPAIPGGRGDMDEDVDAIARVALAGRGADR